MDGITRMDPRYLRYVIYSFLWWTWEILKEILSILVIVPYNAFTAAGNMSAADAIASIRHDAAFYVNRLKTHAITLGITYRDGKPVVSVRSYHEETDRLTEAFAAKKFSGLSALVTDALRTMKQCRFVVISANDTGITFIQFRSDSNAITFDFPLTPGSLNRDYAIEVITYLLKRGFTKYADYNDVAFKYKTYTILPHSDELTAITADFGKDTTLASDAGAHILRKILHVTGRPVVTFG